MQPTDASNAHLADRAIEIRVLKSAVVVFVVTLAMLFYQVAPVFAVFALAYVAYKFSYHRDRIGVFEREDRSIRHPKLEIGLAAIGAAAVAVLVATETVFRDPWVLGGFLQLPPIDLTDVDALLADPLEPVAWGIAVSPAVAAAYAGFQLRHRLLAGLDSEGAAIRATVWESAARLPVYLVWVAVLSARPVFEVYEPVVELVAALLGLTVGSIGGFAPVFGDTFELVVVAGIAAPATVIGTYVAVQRWKYGDATIPEVFGYHGVAPPSRSSHPANLAVPIAVYVLYAVAVFLALDSLPVGDLGLAFAVVVSVVVGANVLGKTTILVRSIAEPVSDNFDAVVTGLVVGLAALFVVDTLVGSGGSFTSLALTYPILAVPLTDLANRVAGTHAVGDISAFLDDIDPDAESLDREAVDRVFVYSRAWDDTLRATATDGLARLVGVTTYRRDDALDVFVRAVQSDRPDIVQSGLRGIAAILARDPTAETYERLVQDGCRDRATALLESDDPDTRVRAAEAAARLYAFGLDSADPSPDDHPTASRIEHLLDAVDAEPDNESLASAVVEYFATAWYVSVRTESEGLEPTDGQAQELLGSLLRLSDRVDDDARLRAVLAVTAGRIPTDDERFSAALDQLDADRGAVRFLATHVVRSSMGRRTDRIDADRLVALLEDPSPPVRRAGGRTITTFLRLDPERGTDLLDRLVLHLQEHDEDSGLTEASVVQALAAVDAERMLDHPTAVATVAGSVDGTPRHVAEPAASLLSSLVEADPAIARQDPVGGAIEAGLTHPDHDVRLHCIEAVVAVVADSVEDGRRFVPGLAANLDAGRKHSGLSAVCLSELLEASPEDGLEVVSELADGIGNLTSVHREAVPFVVRGSTVSAIVVDILTAVVPLDPGRGEVLVEPLIDVATSTEGSTLEGVFEVLADLSTEFPAACRDAVGTAAAVLEDGRPEVRRDAAAVLANVAAAHPGAVEPLVDRLVVATDDDNPRVRAAALVALANVCTATPAALEDDIHRIIGLLDDESVTVREEAARLVVTVAERDPALVEPAAETADRLRRLQREPAVDVDAERLQNASTAIQTGTPVEGGDATDAGDEEIWTPETADEMGASGDTNVFEPGDAEFDADFEADLDAPAEPGDQDVSDADTTLESDAEAAASPDDAVGDVEDRPTAVEGAESEGTEEETDASADVGDRDTAVEPDGTTTDSGESSDQADAVEDLDTAIESSDEPADSEGSSEDVEGLETAIDPTGEVAGGTGRGDAGDQGEGATDEAPESDVAVDDLETAIEGGGDTSGGDEDEAVDDGGGAVDAEDTADEPSDDRSGADASTQADDVESLETAIEPTEDVTGGAGGEDVGDRDTAIEPGGDDGNGASGAADADDVEDLETVIDPGDEAGTDASEEDEPGDEESEEDESAADTSDDRTETS